MPAAKTTDVVNPKSLPEDPPASRLRSRKSTPTTPLPASTATLKALQETRRSTSPLRKNEVKKIVPVSVQPAAVWGAYKPHAHLSTKNIGNALLCAVALLPSVACVYYLFESGCAPGAEGSTGSTVFGIFTYVPTGWIGEVATPGCSEWALASYLGSATSLLTHPFWTVNLLFFLNVSLGFWLVGLLQRSFWLIDPYWTFLPPLIGAYYRAHPSAQSPSPLRGSVALALVCLWAARLTHSYFRREGWKFGEREDWRYTKMATDLPRSWWLLSFFAVGLAQQPMLVGISYPLLAAHTSATPFSLIDVLAACSALTGIAGAYLADTQLATFVGANQRHRAAGEPTAPILREGLWRYSRHPNYFFEQLFWWSLSAFALSAGEPLAVCGTLINSGVLLIVTFMTEDKMLSEWTPERAALYREYQRTTSMLVPLPNRR